MKFPEIPTDNLYKFMALSGIVLVIASYFPFHQMQKAQMNLVRIKGEHELIKQEGEWVLNEFEKLEHKAETLIAQMAELTGISASEIIMALNTGRHLSEIRKVKDVDLLEKHQMKWEELEAKMLDQIKLLREQRIKQIQLQTNLEVHNYHLKMIIWDKRLAQIIAAVGGFLAAAGFKLWYYKLQVPQDLIIKQKVKDEQKQ